MWSPQARLLRRIAPRWWGPACGFSPPPARMDSCLEFPAAEPGHHMVRDDAIEREVEQWPAGGSRANAPRRRIQKKLAIQSPAPRSFLHGRAARSLAPGGCGAPNAARGVHNRHERLRARHEPSDPAGRAAGASADESRQSCSTATTKTVSTPPSCPAMWRAARW